MEGGCCSCWADGGGGGGGGGGGTGLHYLTQLLLLQQQAVLGRVPGGSGAMSRVASQTTLAAEDADVVQVTRTQTTGSLLGLGLPTGVAPSAAGLAKAQLPDHHHGGGGGGGGSHHHGSSLATIAARNRTKSARAASASALAATAAAAGTPCALGGSGGGVSGVGVDEDSGDEGEEGEDGVGLCLVDDIPSSSTSPASASPPTGAAAPPAPAPVPPSPPPPPPPPHHHHHCHDLSARFKPRSVLRTVEALLAAGASPTTANAYGKTPCDIALALADQILPEGAGTLSSASRLGSYSNLLGHADTAALRQHLSAGGEVFEASTLFDRLLENKTVNWDAVSETLLKAAKAAAAAAVASPVTAAAAASDASPAAPPAAAKA